MLQVVSILDKALQLANTKGVIFFEVHPEEGESEAIVRALEEQGDHVTLRDNVLKVIVASHHHVGQVVTRGAHLA